MISWDEGRISQALETLRDAARSGTGVSADARHAQPLLALAATLVDLRRIDQADGHPPGGGHDKLQDIASEAVPPILRARMHLAAGRLADAAVEAEAALAAAQTLAAHGHAWVARSVLGMIALRRGDLAAAARHIRPARPDAALRRHLRSRGDDLGPSPDHRSPHRPRRRPRPGPGYLRRPAGAPRAPRRGTRRRGLADPGSARRRGRGAGGRVARAAEVLAGDNPGFGTLATAAAHALGLAHRDPARLAQAAAQHEDTWARASAAEDLGVLLASKADKDQAVRRLTEALDGYAQGRRPPTWPASGTGSASSAYAAATGAPQPSGRSAAGPA